MFSPTPSLLIGWTTVATRADADALAAAVIAAHLAACVQVDGPIASHYQWKGQAERTEEYRLTLKFLPGQLAALEIHLREYHPYDTPEWIVVPAIHVAEKYLSWARANSSTRPL